MITAGFIQTLLNQNQQSHIGTNSFRPGQIIQGKVNKLFPNQTAEVQVGDQKVIGKLEAPLTMGIRYWFQVQSGEGKIHLKVLSVDEGGSLKESNGSLVSLLKELNLPLSKENLRILNFFLKEQLPLTREYLQSASEWLKGTDLSKEGLEALKQVILRELPVTRDAFLAMKELIKGDSIHSLMEKLRSLLSAQTVSKNGERLLSVLNQLSLTASEKVSEEILSLLIKEWLISNNQNKSLAALTILQKTAIVSPGDEEQLLQQAVYKIFSNPDKFTSLFERINRSDIKVIIESHQSGDKNSLIQLLDKLNASTKDNTTTQLVRLNEQINVKGSELKALLHFLLQTSPTKEEETALIRQLLSLFNQNKQVTQHSHILAQFKTTIVDELDLMGGLFLEKGALAESLGKTSGLELNRQEANLLITLAEERQGNVVKWENGKQILDYLRSIVKTIGINYETELALHLKQTRLHDYHMIDSLKSLLLRLLNEKSPQVIKEASEQLLHKITGIQLLSTESSGPIQQYAMQAPISFWNRTVDLTIQWNGRKKDDGQIDPNYCRVLFYLELEYISEVIVDMQIQNRIMRVTIYNEQENIKELAEPYIESLKENLRQLEYQLSSIHFQSIKEEKIQEKRKNLQIINHSSQINGVDIKI